jgi:hypothetical protein
MAQKPTTQKAAYSAVTYCCHRRILQFTPRRKGSIIQFAGVPMELFYGMPSGINLENFIEIKLQGRYSRTEFPPPPSISFSMMNQRYTVDYGDREEMFPRWAGDQLIDCDNDANTVYRLFLEIYGGRLPEQRKSNDILGEAGTDTKIVQEPAEPDPVDLPGMQ